MVTTSAQTETTASTAANKALVRRFMEEVFNRGNLAVVDELWKPDGSRPASAPSSTCAPRSRTTTAPSRRRSPRATWW